MVKVTMRDWRRGLDTAMASPEEDDRHREHLWRASRRAAHARMDRERRLGEALDEFLREALAGLNTTKD